MWRVPVGTDPSRLLKIFTSVVLCVLFPAATYGQVSADGALGSRNYGFQNSEYYENRGERPIIGLVLSGGGAKGAAHVGVLRLLEELRIPVDLVVGTSMGSIVGGLYAAGYSPETMEEQLTSLEWSQILSNRPVSRNTTDRSKRDDGQFARVEIGFHSEGVALPSGFIAGHRLQFIMRVMTLHVANANDFDSLPIPYRTVATDLLTGDPVIIDGGPLDNAMRASMAVPGVFTPVALDGRILVDGGIVDNLPIDVARAMGAELIIAVNVSPPQPADAPVGSLFGVSMRVIDALTQQNVDQVSSLLGREDILITVEPDGYDAASFGESVRIIENGYRSASAVREALAPLGVSDSLFALYLLQQRQVPFPTVRIDEIETSVRGRTNPQLVGSRLRSRPGEDLDYQKLEADLERVYATGYFQSVDFDMRQTVRGNILTVIAEDKPWGPNYLRFGLSYSEDFVGGSAISLSSEYLTTQLNRLGGEIGLATSIGSTLSAALEYYQPLTVTDRLYFLSNTRARQRIQDVYEDETRRAQRFNRDVGGSLGFGVRPAATVNFFGGLGFDSLTQETAIGPDLPEHSPLNLLGLRSRFEVDMTDSRNFPHRGFGLELAGGFNDRRFGSAANFSEVELSIRQIGTLGRHTVTLSGAAGTSWIEDSVGVQPFSLGGFGSFAGRRPGQLSGRHYGLGSLTYYLRVGDVSSDLGSAIYIGSSVESAGAWQELEAAASEDLIFGGSLFIGVDTALGPAYIAYGRAIDSTFGNLYVILGRTY